MVRRDVTLVPPEELERRPGNQVAVRILREACVGAPRRRSAGERDSERSLRTRLPRQTREFAGAGSPQLFEVGDDAQFRVRGRHAHGPAVAEQPADRVIGGEGGIRTHVGLIRPQPAFEAGPLRPLRYLSALKAVIVAWGHGARGPRKLH